MFDLERAAARMMCVGFNGLTVTPNLRRLIARGVRSVILFSRNYQSPAQLASLCAEIKSLSVEPVMICVDQEGGRVQRFRESFSAIPSMREIGERGDVAFAREVGRTLARELRKVHIDMNLAPVLDVDSNPANPVIGERSFGPDPNLVAKLGCALIEGLQNSGVAACGKHFPGHGDTAVDSHLDLPILWHDLDRINRIELPPFAAAIQSGVASIMVSHVLFTALDQGYPSSMSQPIISGLLRGELGFDRLVISDDLEMNAIVHHFGIERAVVCGAIAGVDLFCICHDAERQNCAIDELIRATRNGDLSVDRLLESELRFDRFCQEFITTPPISVP
jgi:beta-N-acetylhexosaminidase